MKAAACMALLAPLLAVAAEHPQDFAYGVPIQIDGQEALYEVDIPSALYRGVMRRDLGDVRVFNAQGELVPFAIEPARELRSQIPPAVPVRFFPVYGNRSQPLDAVQLKVEKGSGAIGNHSPSARIKITRASPDRCPVVFERAGNQKDCASVVNRSRCIRGD